MARFAFAAVISFMAFFLIIFAVTSNTGTFQFLPGRRAGHATLVASLAFGIAMLTLKRILCILVMIEIGRFPAFIIVATLALLAQASLMAFCLVILAMARHTSHRQFLFIQVPLARQMAVVTLHRLMLAAKVKMSISIVIKAYFLPVLVGMAGLALGSVAPLVTLVLVVLAVTPDAFFRGALVFLVGVTLLAGNIGMLAADQTEV